MIKVELHIEPEAYAWAENIARISDQPVALILADWIHTTYWKLKEAGVPLWRDKYPMSKIIDDPDKQRYPFCDDGETHNYGEKIMPELAEFPQTEITVYAVVWNECGEHGISAIFDTREAAEAAMDKMKLRKKKYMKFDYRDGVYVEQWTIRTMPQEG